MKTANYLFLALAFSAAVSMAQTDAKFKPPIDEVSNLITYEEVLDVPGVPADTLFRRLNSWVKRYYKNPADVIRQNDAATRTFAGQHRFKIYKPDASKKLEKGVDMGFCNYSIKVMCRDNRAKVELTKFNWQQTSYYPAEKWMDPKTPNYDEVVFSGYLRQIDEFSKKLIKDLLEGLEKEPVVKKDDW